VPTDPSLLRLTRTLAKSLRPLGFRQHGLTILLRDGNLGAIVLDPMRWGSSAYIEFTVMVCVASEVLREFDQRNLALPRPHVPKLGLYHLEVPLGWLEGQQDPGVCRLPRSASSADLEALVEDLLPRIESHAVPFIRQHLDDESIRDLWSGVPLDELDGFNRQRLAYLNETIGASDRQPPSSRRSSVDVRSITIELRDRAMRSFLDDLKD
jgi:hypothetical protein